MRQRPMALDISCRLHHRCKGSASSFTNVPGRLERIAGSLWAGIFLWIMPIPPDALENVLTNAPKELASRKD